MTRDRPGALDLLAVARETLIAELLPALEGERRYQALMIANAMAIAERELAAAPDDDTELEQMRLLYGADEVDRVPGDASEKLAVLEARLAKDLRSGELDGGPQLGVRRMLRSRIEARLAVSNPKALGRRGRGPANADDAS